MLVKAILFDCDGVLVDSEVLSLEIELSALSDFGLSYSRDAFIDRFMGMSGDDFHAALDEDCRRRLGHALPAGFRETCHARFRAALKDGRLKEVPGAVAAITQIGHRKAVASSSGTEGLKLKLSLTGLWEAFAPHVYSAERVARGKPAPDLFLHVAEELGVAPEHCLVIEDSVNGIRAAQAAGMRAWGFLGGGHMDENRGERLKSAGAEKILMDWPEAARVLAALAIGA
ncbi:MAG: HAD-IA family hydrolase [Alphaproteobacteria bacterium]|nr:HAD-IA family hydrolase [Alphaproteobacteria bacterium]